MPAKINTKKIAADLEKAARGYDALAEKHVKNRGVSETYRSDAATLRYVAKMVQEGDIVSALRLARYLETAVRDDVPQDLWRMWKPSMPADLQVKIMRRR